MDSVTRQNWCLVAQALKATGKTDNCTMLRRAKAICEGRPDPAPVPFRER